MNLAGLVELLSGGEKIPGCELAHSDAVALVGFYFPGRPYCLVADWTVVDLAVSPRQLKVVVRRGVTPTHLIERLRSSAPRLQRLICSWLITQKRSGIPSSVSNASIPQLIS